MKDYTTFMMAGLVVFGLSIGIFLAIKQPNKSNIPSLSSVVGTTTLSNNNFNEPMNGNSSNLDSSQTSTLTVGDQITDLTKVTSAKMITNLGVIELKLYTNQVPTTVKNFVKLAGEEFYDGTLFHRVIPGFMIQGGDPLTKEQPKNWAIHGTGGPEYRFNDEITPANKNSIGTISMANAGPNTNGSQFFINVANNNFLDTKHTVFGEVVSGFEVVEKIVNVKTNESDHPLEDVKIERIELK